MTNWSGSTTPGRLAYLIVLPAMFLAVTGALVAVACVDLAATQGNMVEAAPRVSWWLRVIGWGALMGAALGLLAAWLVRRSLDALLGQMQEREAELRHRMMELETLNKDLEGFAHTVSHDLRGPLGSVDGFAQALERDTQGQLEPATAEYIHWIREGCRQMHQLIDGILEMARLARAEMAQDEVDLSSIARSVAEELRHRAPQRQVRFEIRDGVRAVGDPRLLRAVVENLMSNAFKFTRGRAEARIEFGMVRNGSGPAFYVRDNGAGFDPSQAAKMFRPFQRLHSSREFEGTGIGLATVQKIVMRHGGTAWAEGEVGKGATIWFTAGGERGAVGV